MEKLTLGKIYQIEFHTGAILTGKLIGFSSEPEYPSLDILVGNVKSIEVTIYRNDIFAIQETQENAINILIE